MKPKVVFDMNQAVAVLSTMHHWTLKKNNRNGEFNSYECQIWNGGRRVVAYSRDVPVTAVRNALEKLASNGTKLKVVR